MSVEALYYGRIEVQGCNTTVRFLLYKGLESRASSLKKQMLE